MSILVRFWRELLILVLALVCYLQFKYRPEEKPPRVEVIVQEKVVFKDKIVYVDRVVTRDRVITKPDGTKIEEKTRTEEKKKEKEKSKEKDKRVEIQIPTEKPKSILLNIGLDPLAKLRDNQYVGLLGGGIRLGNTPFFLTINPSVNLSKPRLENLFIGITMEIE